MIEVVFIRHGATQGNLQRRYIGRTDEPLCQQGLAQVEALRQGTVLQQLSPDVVWVSPMVRTQQTAALLFPRHNLVTVDAFRETDFGLFEGRTAEELRENRAYQSWVDGMCQGPIPGGEAVEAFQARCCQAFAAQMALVEDGSQVVVVTHGGVIMAIWERFGQPKGSFYDYHIGNGCLLQGSYHRETGTLTGAGLG